MMEDSYIKISEINDFIFCPLSIYFHHLLGQLDSVFYHREAQTQGKNVHTSIDSSRYSTSSDVITSLDVCSTKLGIRGKIDIYHKSKRRLVERKKHISKIYDGQIFQLYAQYYCMVEMGYKIDELEIYSYDDNKTYKISLPKDNIELRNKFFDTIKLMRNFDMDTYVQRSEFKCISCIYEDICDRSLL